jgi:hypothetical protein
MKTITVEIKTYECETPELLAEFKRLGLQAFDSLAVQYGKIKDGTYEVETDQIFSNQYNTVCGLRIFEKCTCLSSPGLSRLWGYYIAEGIEKIRAYQKTVSVCHYCGKQYINTDLEWCTSCRGSEYLEVNQKFLLNLTNIMDKHGSSDIIIPKDVLDDIEKQQKERQTAINEKRIKDKLESLKKGVENAKLEREVFQYLIDKGLKFDNVIYYSHTDTFCFGWRNKLSKVEISAIKYKISGWPFKSKVEFKEG